MANTLTDQVAEVPAATGVNRIYGIVGDGLDELTDNLTNGKLS